MAPENLLWLLQVRASSGGTGLPVLPDNLAAVCCGRGGCSREPLLAALAELRGGHCDAAAARLVQAVDGGLLSWLTSGAGAHEAGILVACSVNVLQSSPLNLLLKACNESAFGEVQSLGTESSPTLGALRWQVPEEAWAAQSIEAAAQHIVCSLCGKDFALRRTALLLVIDNLGSRPSLAPAMLLAAAR